MKKNFSRAESILINKINNTNQFKFKGVNHALLKCAKPSPRGSNVGECKTDVYISAQNLVNKKIVEIKISLKLENYEFVENKISESRAKIIFGTNNYIRIITNAATKLKDRFLEKLEIKKEGIDIIQIPLGWKIELFNETKRRLRADLDLSDNQKIDVFSGINRPEVIKNSYVEGSLIENSGVANYVLTLPNDMDYLYDRDLDYLISQIEPIEIFAQKTVINAGFTCLNYFPITDKWDGPRPLAVWIDWKINEGQLRGSLVLDKPFKRDGNTAARIVKQLLK